MKADTIKKTGAAIAPTIIAKGKQIAHITNIIGKQQQQSHFLHKCSVIAKGPTNTPAPIDPAIPIANKHIANTIKKGKSSNKPIR